MEQAIRPQIERDFYRGSRYSLYSYHLEGRWIAEVEEYSDSRRLEGIFDRLGFDVTDRKAGERSTPENH